MEAWSNFFLGELGAAAALAGLLFVSVSVNQERILSLGRMADRGLEALGLLFLVLVVVSLPLVPGQPLRLLGAEILGVATITLIAIVPLQIGYLGELEPDIRRRSLIQVWANRIAAALIAATSMTTIAAGTAHAGGVLRLDEVPVGELDPVGALRKQQSAGVSSQPAGMQQRRSTAPATCAASAAGLVRPPLLSLAPLPSTRLAQWSCPPAPPRRPKPQRSPPVSACVRCWPVRAF